MTYINYIHIGNAVIKLDYQAFGDQHPRFGFPHSANDTSELVGFLRVLNEEGVMNSDDLYVMSFEVKTWGVEVEEVTIANTTRTINRD